MHRLTFTVGLMTITEYEQSVIMILDIWNRLAWLDMKSIYIKAGNILLTAECDTLCVWGCGGVCGGVCDVIWGIKMLIDISLQNKILKVIPSQGYYPDIYSAQEKWQEAGQKFRVLLIDWHLKFHLTCIVWSLPTYRTHLRMSPIANNQYIMSI